MSAEHVQKVQGVKLHGSQLINLYVPQANPSLPMYPVKQWILREGWLFSVTTPAGAMSPLIAKGTKTHMRTQLRSNT